MGEHEPKEVRQPEQKYFDITLPRETGEFIEANFPKYLTVNQLKKTKSKKSGEWSSIEFFHQNIEEALKDSDGDLTILFTKNELFELGILCFQLEQNAKIRALKLGIGTWNPAVHPYFDIYKQFVSQFGFTNKTQIPHMEKLQELTSDPKFFVKGE